MLKAGFSLEAIKQMSEEDVIEYVQILNIFDEIESEKMRKING